MGRTNNKEERKRGERGEAGREWGGVNKISGFYKFSFIPEGHVGNLGSISSRVDLTCVRLLAGDLLTFWVAF